MLGHMFRPMAIHGEVIEEDLHERRYVVVEDLGNNALESRRRRF